MSECCQPRRIRRNRWGLAEDPVGEIALVGGRLYDVVGTYRREVPSNIMLQLRHFNGEAAGDVCAGVVHIVPGHFHVEEVPSPSV